MKENLPKNPRQRARTLTGIALAGTMLVVWVIAGAIFTGLPVIGQVAWGADVDKKIADATKPIEKKVGELEEAVTQQSQVANSLMAAVTASQIRATYERLCSQPSDRERERLNGDLDRYLADYPRYANGRPFPIESLRCGLP